MCKCIFCDKPSEQLLCEECFVAIYEKLAAEPDEDAQGERPLGEREA